MRKYLDAWMRTHGRIPRLYVQLSRNMAQMKNIDILYPVGDPVFIHIYTRPDGTRVYNPVEPRLVENRESLIAEVEKRLAMLIKDEVPVLPEDKEKKIYELLDRVVVLSGYTKIGKKIHVSREDYEKLKYEVYCEKIGLSILEPFVRDPYIEDISCPGIGPIYVVHKVFGALETTISFDNLEDLDNFIIRLSEIIGKPVSYRNPIVDSILPDGSRINIVFGRDISRRGSNFTIRRFPGKPLSITQLINFGTMDSRVAAYLWMLLEEGMSIWVCGETASGKTTTLTAMSVFIRPTAKIVSIEDTPEVYVPHGNWVREVVRQSERITSNGLRAVTMFGLLKAALRQRPNFIIVGEIRGEEGNIAFQAMQTGHPVLATFHAASIQKLIQRLTGYPINVPKTYIDNLNAVIVQSVVHDPETGRFNRRVISVNEILGYDSVEDSFQFIELFRWDPSTDRFLFKGLGSSFLFETKLSIMRGVPGYRIKELYDELELRAEILELLVKLKVFDYDEVWEKIKWVHSVGISRAYSKLKNLAFIKGRA